ncbi:prepilin-type N-terminal cleavage/methylation domain-containing protein [Methylocystis sp. WRRC1]|uniref:GspH/FimT family pseudopilin n=1 Tax=unclassified Methylocystis TaxID=2625913 RepID=UPI0001F877BC|nr:MULTISPECIES: GspH/FimT family pseudopilin [unclassified Methylocystis]MCC3245798.1 prepilin-type N-terminal cleavage/methylation domain-containing protein [Methylocystis sp. WRRC1]
MPQLHRKRGRRAGFTLMETLVVMGLIALLAGMGSQLVRSPSSRLRLESATRGLCGTLRATRARAIGTNSETAVVIDLERKSYTSPVGGEGLLPEETTIKLEIANSQQLSGNRGGFTFFPDGSSTGGDITIEAPNGRATIGVNWLTGEIRCALG